MRPVRAKIYQCVRLMLTTVPGTTKYIHFHNFSIVGSPQSGAKTLNKYFALVQSARMSLSPYMKNSSMKNEPSYLTGHLTYLGNSWTLWPLFTFLSHALEVI
jgi:hypothetical protein